MKQFLFILSTLLVISCSYKKETESNESFKITLLNHNNVVTHSWNSAGVVYRSNNGYYFKDKVTEKYIEVSGNIIITNNE